MILQRIREAERDRKYEEYAGREGDIVTGILLEHNLAGNLMFSEHSLSDVG